jgi:hypothetical protein
MLLIYLLESETTEENDSLYSRSSSSSGQNDSLEGKYLKNSFFERVSFYLQFKLKHAMNLCFYNKTKLKTIIFLLTIWSKTKNVFITKVSYLIAN